MKDVVDSKAFDVRRVEKENDDVTVETSVYELSVDLLHSLRGDESLCKLEQNEGTSDISNLDN